MWNNIVYNLFNLDISSGIVWHLYQMSHTSMSASVWTYVSAFWGVCMFRSVIRQPLSGEISACWTEHCLTQTILPKFFAPLIESSPNSNISTSKLLCKTTKSTHYLLFFFFFFKNNFFNYWRPFPFAVHCLVDAAPPCQISCENNFQLREENRGKQLISHVVTMAILVWLLMLQSGVACVFGTAEIPLWWTG